MMVTNNPTTIDEDLLYIMTHSNPSLEPLLISITLVVQSSPVVGDNTVGVIDCVADSESVGYHVWAFSVGFILCQIRCRSDSSGESVGVTVGQVVGAVVGLLVSAFVEAFVGVNLWIHPWEHPLDQKSDQVMVVQ